MNFLIDADLPKSLSVFLKNKGYNAVDIRDIKPTSISDDKIFKLAKEQNRIIITRDTDFSNVLHYTPTSNLGIIVIRIRLISFEKIFSLVENLLKSISEKELLGSLIILRENRYRILKLSKK